MSRKFTDLFTRSEECVEFGEEQLGYHRVYQEEVNYLEDKLNPEKGKINIAKAGNLDKNKKIVRNPDIDILMNPVNPKEKPFDVSIATVAKENNVSIGITLKRILEFEGMEKTQYFRSLQYLGKLVKRKNCNLVITSGAEEKLDMRKPRELASIGYLLGINQEESLDAVSKNPNSIINEKDI